MVTLLASRRSGKSTRPAVIRPVPAAFGAGILPEEPKPAARRVPVRCDCPDCSPEPDLDFEYEEWKHLEWERTTLAKIEADEAAWDREYARVHGKPFARKPAPSPVDRAWAAGFGLGESGHEPEEVAAPSRMTAAERVAFDAGVAAGAAERWADYGRHLDETAADREATMDALRGREEHELAEAGSCVGH